jgi:cytochrome c553
MRLLLAAPFAFVNLASAALAPKAAPDAAQLDFFEQHIRPVLASKCYKCHSSESEKIKGGLLLDTRAGVLAGGDNGAAVVPGDPKNSPLLKALRWVDKDTQMPPKEQLPADVVADFEKWIAMGVPDPREGDVKTVKSAVRPPIDIEKGRQFWSFQPPKAVAAPAVKDTAWPRTDIDRFLLAGLEAQKLKPVADAEPRALVRRIYFDLIGLPPTPEEVGTFVAAAAVDHDMAVAAIVDKLLASPQFGERWGRHWLDVARYAESTGKERNFTFPEAWRYRDWVIGAVNEDKPYDQFIREQVAGDLLPAANDDERAAHTVATAFLALGPKSINEKKRDQFQMDMIDEQIDVTTKAVLGVTVACARCHDHKFDPIPQADYYAMAGIFRSTKTFYGTDTFGGKNRNASALLPLGPAPTGEAAAVPEPAAPSVADLEARFAKMTQSDPKKAARLASLSMAQKEQLAKRFAERFGAPLAPPSKTDKRKGAYAMMKGTGPKTGGPESMGVQEGSPTDARILTRGEVDQPTDTVPRGFVQVLSTKTPPAIPADASGRVQLADWLTSRDNPQTARVMVNRVWSYLFGQGLVRTADNFGATGEKPSNPTLLGTLAVKFMDQGWSVKQFVRSIVLSRAYQLGTAHDSAANEVDPDNRLVWHQSPRRLDAEAIRDAMLAASGKLDLTPDPSSFVALKGDAYIGRGVRPESFTEYESSKRSVYLPIVRDCVPEVLDLFDFAEPSLVVATRDATNVPSQALYLMNNKFVREQAAALAQRVLAAKLDHPQRIDLAYQLALGRKATPQEIDRAQHYLLDEARGLVSAKSGDKDKASELSWTTFCQALFACAEFRYLR